MQWRKATAVAIGAVFGAGIRWFALEGLRLNPDPTILTVNIVGAAILSAVIHQQPRIRSANTETMLTAGFCGALTTWSSLALLTAQHLRSGDYVEGLAWVVANILGAVAIAAFMHHVLTIRQAGLPTYGSDQPGTHRGGETP